MTQILIYHIKEIMSGAMLIATTMMMPTTTVMNILRMKLSRDVIFNITMPSARKFWYGHPLYIKNNLIIFNNHRKTKC
jgi:hypothetical protein